MSRKAIIKFGSTTLTSAETIVETAGSPITQAYSEFARMNVALKVTVTGTSPVITFIVEEQFGGNWVETARSKGITATGNYLLLQGIVPPDQTSVKNHGAFWGLGSGSAKRITTVVAGTQIVLAADIYFVFFD